MVTRLLLLFSLLTGLSLTSYPVQATVNESVAANRYTADGVVTVFNYTFTILDETALRVLVDTSVQTLNTHYAVAGVGDDAGGTITFVDPPAASSIVTILRAQPASQLSDYQPHEAFPSVRVEKDYDKLVMQIQQLKEVASRSYHVAENEPGTDAIALMPTKTQRANKFFTWNGQGEPTASEGSVGGGSDSVIASGSVTSRTLADRFAELYSIYDFNAVCDGVTDTSAAIQLGIDTLGSITSGGTKVLRFPVAKCAVSTKLTNPYNNVLLEGVGAGGNSTHATKQDYLTAGTTIIWTGAVGGTMFDMGPPAGSSYRVYGGGIKGIFWEGDGIAATCVLIRSVSDAYFWTVAEECTTVGIDIAVEATLTTDPASTQHNLFDHLVAIQESATGGIGIRLRGGTAANVSLNTFNHVEAFLLNSVGVDVGQSDGNIFHYVQTHGSGNTGLLLRAGTSPAFARDNLFGFVQTGNGGMVSQGLASGTAAAKHNHVIHYSLENGGSYPTVERGSSLNYGSYLGYLRIDENSAKSVLELRKSTNTNGSILADVQFSGYDSADTEQNYASIRGALGTNTDGAEVGTIQFYTYNAGAETLQGQWRDGVTVGSPTGSFLGVGTLNVDVDLYKDGSNITGLELPVYGAGVPIDQRVGRAHIIEPTNGTAFTIGNPANDRIGDIVIITIKNTFGVLGAVTFNSVYKLGAAWTQPALDFQRTIMFLSDGTDLHEISRTTVDVTN